MGTNITNKIMMNLHFKGFYHRTLCYAAVKNRLSNVTLSGLRHFRFFLFLFCVVC